VISDAQKNTITNILGLALFALNVYMFYWDALEISSFLIMTCISLALFLFKADQTKEWLKKALSKILSK
jgi:hypothetical protein